MSENGPSSLVYIKAKESYPKKETVFDDPSLSIPFPELIGEHVEFVGKCLDAIFALSNFRFFAAYQHAFINVPLMLVESLEWKGKELPEIFISCKIGQSFQLRFESGEECSKWYERLKKKCVAKLGRLESLFAFPFYAWGQDADRESLSADDTTINCFSPRENLHYDCLNEYRRMGFDNDDAWKITELNSKFELCPSYPKLHIVPSHITDEKLENIAKFRTSKRFPSAVWRHSGNGAVIVRCSQPKVGWLYWRCEDDEYCLQTLGSVVDLTGHVVNGNKGTLSNGSGPHNDGGNEHNSDTPLANGFREDKINGEAICTGIEKKVLVVDCRSYTAAFANRAKGGGSECTEYYPNCKIQFMGLANIHSIRKSFQSLREICCKKDEQPGWLASLEATEWLSHISLLIKTSLVVVKAVAQEGQHVVVHCSDGWDRTAQVVALAELLLDPFYRTIQGFRVLLEREWLAFGHKFADRCCHGCQEDQTNERCPVFLQWLDCVHQLLKQFPCSFEFNETFLVKLAHHTYSCLFGTFLCNTEQERLEASIRSRTCSVWSMLDAQSRNCRNFLYSTQEREVLYPEYQVRHLFLWSSLYLSTPLVYFGKSPSNCNDAVLTAEHEHEYSRDVPESRPNLGRRNSDGDVKVLSTNNDENFVATSGARDDSDLYVTKSLSSKEANMSPCKGLLLNNFERRSNENIQNGCEKNSIDQAQEKNDKVGNGCENAEFDQNGILGGDDNEKKLLDQNGTLGGGGNEKTTFHQNGTLDVDGDESSVFDENGSLAEKCDADDSLAGSSNTLVDESSGDSSQLERDTVADSENVNGQPNGLEISTTRTPATTRTATTPTTTTKAINCRSNHRFRKYHSADDSLLHRRMTSSHHQNGVSNAGRTFKKSENTPSSPSEITFNKLRKHLDTDGLAIVMDPIQARHMEFERFHRAQIDELQKQLQTQGCLCEPRAGFNHEQEMVSNLEATFDGPTSLSSNATTDTCGSWEHVEDDDVTPVLWVPDHVAVSCGGCDLKFTMTNRKHHCRNCGKVFCGSCCNDMTPVPSEQLYDPVRVCKSCYEKLHVPSLPDITVAAS